MAMNAILAQFTAEQRKIILKEIINIVEKGPSEVIYTKLQHLTDLSIAEKSQLLDAIQKHARGVRFFIILSIYNNFFRNELVKEFDSKTIVQCWNLLLTANDPKDHERVLSTKLSVIIFPFLPTLKKEMPNALPPKDSKETQLIEQQKKDFIKTISKLDETILQDLSGSENQFRLYANIARGVLPEERFLFFKIIKKRIENSQEENTIRFWLNELTSLFRFGNRDEKKQTLDWLLAYVEKNPKYRSTIIEDLSYLLPVMSPEDQFRTVDCFTKPSVEKRVATDDFVILIGAIKLNLSKQQEMQKKDCKDEKIAASKFPNNDVLVDQLLALLLVVTDEMDYDFNLLKPLLPALTDKQQQILATGLFKHSIKPKKVLNNSNFVLQTLSFVMVKLAPQDQKALLIFFLETANKELNSDLWQSLIGIPIEQYAQHFLQFELIVYIRKALELGERIFTRCNRGAWNSAPLSFSLLEINDFCTHLFNAINLLQAKHMLPIVSQSSHLPQKAIPPIVWQFFTTAKIETSPSTPANNLKLKLEV